MVEKFNPLRYFFTIQTLGQSSQVPPHKQESLKSAAVGYNHPWWSSKRKIKREQKCDYRDCSDTYLNHVQNVQAMKERGVYPQPFVYATVFKP